MVTILQFFVACIISKNNKKKEVTKNLRSIVTLAKNKKTGWLLWWCDDMRKYAKNKKRKIKNIRVLFCPGVGVAAVVLSGCVAVPLCRCVAVPLCRCVAVLLCRCAAVVLWCCPAVLLCRCAAVWLCGCVAVCPAVGTSYARADLI